MIMVDLYYTKTVDREILTMNFEDAVFQNLIHPSKKKATIFKLESKSLDTRLLHDGDEYVSINPSYVIPRACFKEKIKIDLTKYFDLI